MNLSEGIMADRRAIIKQLELFLNPCLALTKSDTQAFWHNTEIDLMEMVVVVVGKPEWCLFQGACKKTSSLSIHSSLECHSSSFASFLLFISTASFLPIASLSSLLPFVCLLSFHWGNWLVIASWWLPHKVDCPRPQVGLYRELDKLGWVPQLTPEDRLLHLPSFELLEEGLKQQPIPPPLPRLPTWHRVFPPKIQPDNPHMPSEGSGSSHKTSSATFGICKYWQPMGLLRRWKTMTAAVMEPDYYMLKPLSVSIMVAPAKKWRQIQRLQSHHTVFGQSSGFIQSHPSAVFRPSMTWPRGVHLFWILIHFPVKCTSLLVFKDQA